jgi:phospholipase/carboxylesterase
VPEPGRLSARPGRVGTPGPVRERALGLASGRDGRLQVPAAYRPDRPAPLAVMLHGAGSAGQRQVDRFREQADATGTILLAPDSRAATWDVLVSDYGPDVAFLDRALSSVFGSYAVDPARVAIGGFSDGASYALCLGIANGDLFGHVLAFSPGFAAPPAQHGAPRFYVSHGTRDDVLPIGRCSRRLVPMLRGAGYEVTYREFDGGHAVPPELAAEAFAALAGG